jgi:glycosyltransferase involved in cell wall biosynthesis
MSEPRVVYLCPSFAPYWVQIFDAIADRIGAPFTVVTQSMQSATNARLAQSMGKFERLVIRGGRLSLAERSSEHGAGTPFGLNIAPTLPIALMQLKPQVVITNNFSLWTLASIGMGYPTVIFWEGTHHTERTVRRWRLLLRRWMAQRAGAFVVNGSAARAYIHESLSVPQARIFEGGLCCSCPPEQLAQPRRERRDGKVTNYICVSRLIKGKGIDHLLAAAALLRDYDAPARQFTLTIVGDGPERDPLMGLCRKLGLDGIVSFAGAVHPDAIWKFYARADVKILPTLQDNWPLVVLEAMTMGLPVLLSKYAGSHQDLVLEGRNGYSFDPEDHARVAELMAAYSIQPDRITEQGDTSRDIVRKYDANRIAAAFMQALNMAGHGT